LSFYGGGLRLPSWLSYVVGPQPSSQNFVTFLSAGDSSPAQTTLDRIAPFRCLAIFFISLASWRAITALIAAAFVARHGGALESR
jgi:hypothetical protein